jgi:hypothetical protein
MVSPSLNGWRVPVNGYRIVSALVAGAGVAGLILVVLGETGSTLGPTVASIALLGIAAAFLRLA